VLTRNGICYHLPDSPYTAKVNGFTFYFSSSLYLEKFLNQLEENRVGINASLSCRFNINVNFKSFCDFLLYMKIEKRGFYVVNNEGVELCQNSITFGGEKVI